MKPPWGDVLTHAIIPQLEGTESIVLAAGILGATVTPYAIILHSALTQDRVSLKLKEMSQTVSEPFHFFEFRHGPMSMVDEQTLVVGMVSEGGYDHEMAIIGDVRRLGGKTLTLGEKGTDIELKSGIAEHVRNVLYLPVLQLFAFDRAVHLGKNPDKPRNLTSVVELDLGV